MLMVSIMEEEGQGMTISSNWVDDDIRNRRNSIG